MINIINETGMLSLYFIEDGFEPMSPLEGRNKESEKTIAKRVKLNPWKTKTGLKILTPNKLFTRLSVLLAEIKAGNNSSKLKNEIRQILYLLSL